MASTLKLKNAIETSLSNDFVGPGKLFEPDINIKTGESTIRIFEVSPSFDQTLPCIAYDVIDARPIDPEEPLQGHYLSTVLIYAISHGSPRTTRIADQICEYFSRVPCGASRSKWFRDLSDDCVNNKYTKFVNRFPAKMKHDYKTDVYTEMVRIQVTWTDLACVDCETVRCDDANVSECPIDQGEITYDDECDEC